MPFQLENSKYSCTREFIVSTIESVSIGVNNRFQPFVIWNFPTDGVDCLCIQ